MMNYLRVALTISLAATLCGVGRAQDEINHEADVPPILKIGAQAPDFNLPGIDGKQHSLKDYASAKVLAIVFTCDHCPIAQMYEKRIEQLAADYRERGVALVAINPNDPKAVHLSEMGHTDLGDTLPEMKIRAAYRHFNFPFLSDGATQEVALKYGPTATPHVFLFDQERKLRYEGRIDNNPREELVTRHEARDAVEAMLAGKPVLVQSTPAMGCSTKWAYKEKGARDEISQSEQEPVRLELTSTDQLKALRKNGTGKLILVNFWATWCAPCTEEFPEIQKMVRMYRKRQLQIVTVSINNPDENKMVQAFLDEQHAINTNLLWNTNDAAEAVAAFGTNWSGGVPYTVLLGMNGEILYRSQGAMNPLDVKRAILKNLPDDRYIGQHAYWNSSF
ncbi:MAG TPA: redoxin domain-containing protein [Bryobacteraceae bacterium]|nr:redoxin domain-containing protein [Bryobacteraceae bacterium]